MLLQDFLLERTSTMGSFDLASPAPSSVRPKKLEFEGGNESGPATGMQYAMYQLDIYFQLTFPIIFPSIAASCFSQFCFS